MLFLWIFGLFLVFLYQLLKKVDKFYPKLCKKQKKKERKKEREVRPKKMWYVAARVTTYFLLNSDGISFSSWVYLHLEFLRYVFLYKVD